jgi:hypothetical protein
MGTPPKLIGDFLIELSEDLERADEYARDQAAFLERESGLTEEQQRVLLTNDFRVIREAIQAEYEQSTNVIVVPIVRHVTARTRHVASAT